MLCDTEDMFSGPTVADLGIKQTCRIRKVLVPDAYIRGGQLTIHRFGATQLRSEFLAPIAGLSV